MLTRYARGMVAQASLWSPSTRVPRRATSSARTTPSAYVRCAGPRSISSCQQDKSDRSCCHSSRTGRTPWITTMPAPSGRWSCARPTGGCSPFADASNIKSTLATTLRLGACRRGGRPIHWQDSIRLKNLLSGAYLHGAATTSTGTVAASRCRPKVYRPDAFMCLEHARPHAT